MFINACNVQLRLSPSLNHVLVEFFCGRVGHLKNAENTI